MPVHESFRAYTQSVCDQIRWKRARPMIAKELEDHLCDQCEAYQRAGQNEESAVQESVRQMGDPITLGADFDRTHRPKAPWTVILLAAVILLAGFFLREPLGLNGGEVELSDWIALGLSIALCAGAYFLDISFLGRFALPLSGLSMCIAFVLCCAPHWIPTFHSGGLSYGVFFDFTIDMRHRSLFAPLSFALLLYGLRGRAYKGIVLAGGGYLLWSVLLIGIYAGHGWFLYSIVAFVLLTMAVMRGWFRVRKGPVLLGLGLCALVALLFYVSLLTQEGMSVRLDMDTSATDLLGMWLRDMRGTAQAFGAVPPPAWAFAPMEGLGLLYLMNRFGFVAAIAVFVLFVVFSVWLLRLSLRQSSMQGRLVALSISLTFILEAAAFFLNNCILTISVTAVLPFFAGANDALVLHGILLGFLLSVFRSEPLLLDRFTPLGSGISKRICWEDGKLTIDFRS